MFMCARCWNYKTENDNEIARWWYTILTFFVSFPPHLSHTHTLCLPFAHSQKIFLFSHFDSSYFVRSYFSLFGKHKISLNHVLFEHSVFFSQWISQKHKKKRNEKFRAHSLAYEIPTSESFCTNFMCTIYIFSVVVCIELFPFYGGLVDISFRNHWLFYGIVHIFFWDASASAAALQIVVVVVFSLKMAWMCVRQWFHHVLHLNKWMWAKSDFGVERHGERRTDQEIEREQSVSERDLRCEWIFLSIFRSLGTLPIDCNQRADWFSFFHILGSFFFVLLFRSRKPKSGEISKVFALFITRVHMLFNRQKNDEHGKFHAYKKYQIDKWRYIKRTNARQMCACSCVRVFV